MGNYKKLFIAAGVFVVLIGIMSIYMTNLTKDDQSSVEHESSTNVSMESSSSSSSESQPNSDQPVATTKVRISNYEYSPAVIKVKVGDTVTWTNEDSVAHTVTAQDGSSDGPNSENLGKGETYSYTFSKAGTYEYYCAPHPYMKAKVIVE